MIQMEWLDTIHEQHCSAILHPEIVTMIMCKHVFEVDDYDYVCIKCGLLDEVESMY